MAAKGKGQMLRPTSGFPTEVTPQSEGLGASAVIVPAPAPELPLPKAPSAKVQLPAADAPLDEIEKAADAIIAEANLQLRAAETRASIEWVNSVVAPLRLVWETDAHKQAIDPSTGKAYRGVRKWAADRGISKSHFYRLINEVPVREALGETYTGPIPSREAEFGARLLRANNAEAVRRVWAHAAEHGDPKLKNLEAAAKVLDYQISNRKEEGEEGGALSNQAKAILSLALPAKKAWNEDEVRAAAASNLAGTRESIAQLDRFRAVLVSVLPDRE